MAQKQEQRLVQTQAQQMSTMQVALASLVQLPLMELSARVENEMLDNAALEEGGNGSGEDDVATEEGRDVEEEWGGPEQEELRDSLGDYRSDDDIPSYLQARADEAREQNESLITGGTSSYDDLMAQIGEHNLDGHEKELVRYLIGSLDEDGFLRKDLDSLADELAIYQNVNATSEDLGKALNVLQTFEPRGIGARTLQECLRLQLEDPELHSPYRNTALDIVNHSFNIFAGKRWEALAEKYEMDAETLEGVKRLLTRLNPRPGSALGSGSGATAPTVVADFFITVEGNGEPEVRLNNGDIPELCVSPAFRESISAYRESKHPNREQHDAYVYAKKKVESAQMFIGLLERRKQTLLSVMRAIVDFQKDFFKADDDETLLVPLTLREVADRAGVDISTVSRVTSSKYAETAYGIYPLKHFFSRVFTSGDGEEVSSREVRRIIREIVDGEDLHHPFSDDAIAESLKQKGYAVARRTVAKYREQMGIPIARLRRN